MLFWIFRTFIRCLLVAGLFLGLAIAGDDPVVIRVGDIQQTRSEFEQQFGISMLMTAISAGAPMKSGMLIRDLREHYLEQRVKELLLLQQAQRRGIQISEVELDRAWIDFTQSLPGEYGGGVDLQGANLRDEAQIRDYLREQLLLARIRQILPAAPSELPGMLDARGDDINDLITELRHKSTVFTCIECLE